MIRGSVLLVPGFQLCSAHRGAIRPDLGDEPVLDAELNVIEHFAIRLHCTTSGFSSADIISGASEPPDDEALFAEVTGCLSGTRYTSLGMTRRRQSQGRSSITSCTRGLELLRQSYRHMAHPLDLQIIAVAKPLLLVIYPNTSTDQQGPRA